MSWDDSLRVVAAAIKVDADGIKIFSLPKPARHSDIVSDMRLNHGIKGNHEHWLHGFLLNDGNFVSRKAAANVALRNEQIKKLKFPPNLYSEDLW